MYQLVLAGCWALWPLIALLGGQGTSPLMGLMLLASLPLLWQVRPRPALYACLFLTFVLWAAITAFWSPAGGALVTVNPATGVMAIDSGGLRVPLLAVLLSLAIAGGVLWTRSRPDASTDLPIRALLLALALQALILIIIAIWSGQSGRSVWFIKAYDIAEVIPPDTLRGWLTETQDSVIQNIIRNAVLFCLAIPLAAALLLRNTSQRVRLGVLAIATPPLLWLMNDLWAQAAVLSILTGLAIAALVWLAGRRAFLWLGAGSAAYIFSMPLLVSLAAGLAAGQTLPLSFQARLETWQAVLARISEKPLFGWGLEASKTWKEVHSSGALEGARVVPGHPHNMVLQIWVETGLLGAALLATAILLLGARLAKADWQRPVAMASGALWGAVIVFASVSYAAWNDAFWAGVAFIAIGLLLLQRHLRTAP